MKGKIKVLFINKKEYPIRTYFVNQYGKIFFNKIIVNENDSIEFHIDEIQKTSLFLRFIFRFVVRASYADKYDSYLPFLLNKDIVVANYNISDFNGKGSAIFEIGDSINICSEGVSFKELSIENNPRINKNVEISHIKQYLLALFVLFLFIGIVALSIMVPIWFAGK